MMLYSLQEMHIQEAFRRGNGMLSNMQYRSGLRTIGEVEVSSTRLFCFA